MTMQKLIKDIFYYIDTYQDEKKSAIVQELVEEYIRSLRETKLKEEKDEG